MVDYVKISMSIFWCDETALLRESGFFHNKISSSKWRILIIFFSFNLHKSRVISFAYCTSPKTFEFRVYFCSALFAFLMFFSELINIRNHNFCLFRVACVPRVNFSRFWKALLPSLFIVSHKKFGIPTTEFYYSLKFFTGARKSPEWGNRSVELSHTCVIFRVVLNRLFWELLNVVCFLR